MEIHKIYLFFIAFTLFCSVVSFSVFLQNQYLGKLSQYLNPITFNNRRWCNLLFLHYTELADLIYFDVSLLDFSCKGFLLSKSFL